MIECDCLQSIPADTACPVHGKRRPRGIRRQFQTCEWCYAENCKDEFCKKLTLIDNTPGGCVLRMERNNE